MIFPKSYLSQHAQDRILERLRISPQDLLDLLNGGHGKKIGRSARTHLAHRLLWSHVDESLLVAIQDVVDGTILTVLTLELYCGKYGKNITDRRICRVVNQMVHAGLVPEIGRAACRERVCKLGEISGV